MKHLFKLLFVAATMAMSSLTTADPIRIGVEGAYPPFSQTNADGSLSGFDIDIAYALCSAMGHTCTLVKQDWDGIIPALLAKKYDAIIASMSITEERKKKVAFTDKYYQMPVRFIRAKGSGLALSAQGLKGKRIGVQRGTTFDDYATDNYGNQAEVIRYTSQEEVFLDLQTGRLDATLAERAAVEEGFLSTPAGKNFELFGPDITNPRWFGEGIGIALRKEDKELAQQFNAAIAKIRQNGEYRRINNQYFNYDIYGD